VGLHEDKQGNATESDENRPKDGLMVVEHTLVKLNRFYTKKRGYTSSENSHIADAASLSAMEGP